MRVVGLVLAGVLALSAPIAAHADPPGSKMRPGGPAPGIAQWGGTGSGSHPVPGHPSQWGGWARPYWAPNPYNGLWGPPGAWGGPYTVWGGPYVPYRSYGDWGALWYPYAEWREPFGGWGNP